MSNELFVMKLLRCKSTKKSSHTQEKDFFIASITKDKPRNLEETPKYERCHFLEFVTFRLYMCKIICTFSVVKVGLKSLDLY